MSCDSTNSSSTPAGGGFPNASTMETIATNLPVVWEEICKIQQAILSASSQCQPGGGQMCTTVAGDTPMTFTSGVTGVTVVNGGSGYFQDTPAVEFVPPIGGPGTGATATVVTNGGNILAITITAGGTGYQPIPATMTVSSIAGINADLQPLVDINGGVIGVNIINGGTGYTINDTVVAHRIVAPNPAYVDAVFRITSVSVTGQIIEVIILQSGSGYQPSTVDTQIVSTLNSSLPYPLGTGFLATATVDSLTGAITQVTVTNSGAGYAVDSPFLVISNPGTGATTSVALSGSSVSAITVINEGNNYTLPISGTVYNPPTAALPNPPSTPAVVTINVATNTFGTNPNLYWQVWAGTTTNKAIQLQLNQVLSYFGGLGYTIQIQTNPATGYTIQWKICW